MYVYMHVCVHVYVIEFTFQIFFASSFATFLASPSKCKNNKLRAIVICKATTTKHLKTIFFVKLCVCICGYARTTVLLF